MVQRTTVGVPDELWKKMEKWKESLNYSKIFQTAISEVIKRKEGLQLRLKEDFDMEATIERLREEKLDGEGDYFEFGKEEGFVLAKIAHYSELKYVVNDWEWEKGDDPRQQPEGMESLGNYFESIIENDEGLGFDKFGETYETLDRFVEGFIEGVKSFWNEIEDKI